MLISFFLRYSLFYLFFIYIFYFFYASLKLIEQNRVVVLYYKSSKDISIFYSRHFRISRSIVQRLYIVSTSTLPLFIHPINTFFLAPWRVIGNRRKFFENFAKEHGFDPLVPENWYLRSRKQIANYKVLFIFIFILILFIYFREYFLISYQGASRVVAYHKGSLFSRALMELFPDIGLDKSKLYYLSTLVFTFLFICNNLTIY
jgi:hypothetical protein